VLLVEDYRDAREMYAEFLQVNGLEILEAPDGPTGLAQIAVGKPDVVVLDVGLPSIGGQVLRRIRGDPETRNVPVIMISAANAESFVSEAISAGAPMALSKPLLPPGPRPRLADRW
jgi:DNA-binding response OmpR family regulator